MCYMTIISTTSDLDLGEFSSDDVVFSRKMPGIPEEQLLKYQNKWYVGSSEGCSCGFRHLMAENYRDLGFAAPVDWFEEDSEDIAATLKLIKIFKKLVSSGSKLECIDAWTSSGGCDPELSGSVVVNLTQMPEPDFRLIESYHHEFEF